MSERMTEEFNELTDRVEELKLAQINTIITNIQDGDKIIFNSNVCKLNIEVLAMIGSLSIAFDGNTVEQNIQVKALEIEAKAGRHSVEILASNAVGIVRITGRGVKRIG